jgi:hypothetical protein
MKIAAVAFFCIILTAMAWPETVTVNAGLQLPPELSSSHVRIAVMLDGKPLKGARVDLYRLIRYQDHAGPLCFSGLTNENGVATPPAIAEGDYHALATVDDVSIFLWLRVIDEGTAMTTLVGMDLTEPVQKPRRIQDAAVKRAEGLPVRDRVQAFQGSVLDFSGAVLTGAKIRILKNGPEGRAAAGHFSAQLSHGLYLGIVYSEGFCVEAVPFEVTKEGFGDVRVVLQVGPMALPILVATPSGTQ